MAISVRLPNLENMDDIDQLCERLPALKVCEEAIRQSTEALIHAFQSGNKLLLCGNGGSAADSEHIAGELVKRFSNPRPLPRELAESLGVDLYQNLHGALPALSLPSMIGFHTAFANDDNPEYAFAQQVLAFGKTGDILLAISTSGNSRNLIHAVHTAKSLGLKTITLTNPSTTLRGRGFPSNFSIASTRDSSSGLQRVKASPSVRALPVLPMRWT